MRTERVPSPEIVLIHIITNKRFHKTTKEVYIYINVYIHIVLETDTDLIPIIIHN